jgi:tripartite-type tricarboxylate transporter receptor subunit TctC
VKRLEQALIAAVQKPDVKLLLTRAGLEVTGVPAAQLSRELDEERRYWKPLVETSGFHNEE